MLRVGAHGPHAPRVRIRPAAEDRKWSAHQFAYLNDGRRTVLLRAPTQRIGARKRDRRMFSRSHAPRGSARPARSACEGLSCCGRREMNHPSMRIPQQWTEDRPSARADAGHRREKEGERLHLHVAGHLQHRPRIPGVEVRARASASFTSLLANPVHETIRQPVPMCTKLLQKRTHLRNMSSCLHREQQTDNTCNRNLQ